MKYIFPEYSGRQSTRVSGRKVFLAVLLSVFLLGSLLLATPALAAPTIFPSTLPPGQVGVSYSTSLLAVGVIGTPTWTVTGGSLPPGLNLAPTTGIISGTPTTAGTYNFLVRVADSADGNSPDQPFSITIAAEPITFTTLTLDKAEEGVSYFEYIVVDGGKSPYSFSLTSGTLPSGLTLDAVNGIIEGTPDNGTAGTYTFTIQVTDSSSSPISASHSYSLVVESGYFKVVVSIGVSLSAGETNVYYRTDEITDPVMIGTLEGGEELTKSFDVDETVAISIDDTVLSPTDSDIRFIADDDEIIVDADNPNAAFTYTTEYYIELKTDPAQITTISGSDWYESGDYLEATAQVLIEESEDTQYRFAYWLLPDGDEDVNEELDWKVTSPGKATATYDTYYLLTVTSTEGDVEGGGWYEAGTEAEWSVEPAEISMTGFLGFLGGKLQPEAASDSVVMSAPKTVTVDWGTNYTMPAVYISLFVLALLVAAFFVYRHFHPPVPKMAPVAAPAPPTIVFMDGRLGPGTTKDQLVDQFKQLLEKYEDEVGGGVEGGGARRVPETQLLGAGKKEAAATCGNSSKRLLRTVVGHWHKVEEEVLPPDEKKGIKTTSIRTVWGREIYKEWEVFVCTLPQGHSGNHHGAISKSYTLQDSVSEEKSYTPRQKTTPPKSHFTDELPVVDVAPHQVMPPDEDIAADETISPDEVIPPDEAAED